MFDWRLRCCVNVCEWCRCGFWVWSGSGSRSVMLLLRLFVVL